MQVAVAIVLARLLTPTDFGTLALVMVVVGFTNTLAFLGVGPAVVQRRTLTDQDVAVAWTLSLLGGLVACGLVAGGAPLLARLVGDPDTSSVFVAVSPTLILVGLRTCSLALLRRRMQFRRLMVIDITSYAFGYALVAVLAALGGWGLWSLVAALLCQGVLASVGAFAYARHPLRLSLRRQAAKGLLRFGGGMTASSLANYVALNGDNFVVGRLLGPSPLGLYSRAYYLMSLPLGYLTQILTQVLLPAYSRIQDDRERMAKGYIASVFLVFLVTAPAMMLVLVSAPYLVAVLFGSQWTGAVAPLQILAAFGALRATYHLGGAIAQASGQPWKEFVRQLLYAALVIAGAVVGSRWGIAGVSWGVGLAIVVMYVAMARLTHGLLSFTWMRFAAVHRAGVACGAVVLGAGVAGRVLLEALGASDAAVMALLLVVCTGVAIVTAGLLPRSWRPEGAERVMSLALDMMPPRLGGPLRWIVRVKTTCSSDAVHHVEGKDADRGTETATPEDRTAPQTHDRLD
jgi:PST family polysaccharide transporter